MKSSVAKGKEVKLQVHHKEGIANWEQVIDVIFEQLLCSPDKMEPLCLACHGKEHPK